MNKNLINLIFILTMFFGFSQSKKFRVVLDAGHGGKDYGATYHGNIEKKIALKTVLKIGQFLEKQPDIEVIYTRDSDVFIELIERANIANKSKSNLFISIHCNANANLEASGTETFVMGITKNAANLEVAKKENAVVTLETNYKIKYDGYDPNSPESVIGISIMQEEMLQNSIDLASKVQIALTKNTKSKNRGVKQAGFLLLKKITMPRVLIEMGFVSNKEEGAILNSDEGQNNLAESISEAIIAYKKENFKVAETVVLPKKDDSKTKLPKDANPKNSTNIPVKENVIYKIQISASAKKVETISSNFKGLKNISVEKENTIYKYFYGNEKEYKSAKQLLEEAVNKGYTSAFIAAFKNGKKVTLTEALK